MINEIKDQTNKSLETISIPRWQMEKIEDTLRLASNIHHSSLKETCFDRCVCKAWGWAKESLNIQPDNILNAEETIEKPCAGCGYRKALRGIIYCNVCRIKIDG